MQMNSRVWLALSQDGKEQYRKWFGDIELRYEGAPDPAREGKALPKRRKIGLPRR